MKPESAERPEAFEVYGKYATYAPVGVVSLEMATNLIAAAVIYARNNAINKLLIDATQLTGFPNPSLADRYWIIREWASEAAGQVAAAIVLQPHLIDPERFGVVVAWNLGMRADVFTSAQEGLAWLLGSSPPLPLHSR